MRAFLVLLIFYGAFSVWAQVHSFLTVDFQNDFLDCSGHGTDRYYTAGNFITYTNANVIRKSVWSISLVQQAFTPSDLQDTIVSNFDYPYAGLLYIQGRYVWMRSDTSWFFTVLAGFGQTGKGSGVAGLQRSLHRIFKDEMPLGWKYMLELGMFYQSSLGLQKILLHGKNKNLSVTQQWEWGTLFKKVQLGLFGSLGNNPPISIYYSPAAIALPKVSSGNFFNRLSLFYAPNVSWVISNIILERGLLASTSRSLSTGSKKLLRNTVVNFECGIAYPIRSWTFLFRQNWQSAESYKSLPHHYGTLSAIYSFDQRNR